MKHRVIVLPFLGAVALVAFAGLASADSEFVPLPSLSLPVAPSAMVLLPSETNMPVVSGLMAFLDPESGRLTGPIGNLQVPMDQLQTAISPESLVPVTMPDGSVMLDLRGTLQDYVILQVDAFGHSRMQCVTDPRLATPFVSLPAPSPYAER